MGYFDTSFEQEKDGDNRKRIFISFAIEDEQYRDHLVAQARNKKSPFDFIDMSVKDPWVQSEWRRKCRTKIKRCHGMIVLLSQNTYHSSGARWEIRCAKEERIPVIGMHIRKNHQAAILPELGNNSVMTWSWKNVTSFIESLNQ